MTNSWAEPPSRPALDTALPSLLKQLKLAQFRSQWQAAEQQAQADGWTPASYLYVLAEQEHQQRQQARLRRLLHEAQLPVPKTLADLDWDANPDLSRAQIEQLAHDTGWIDRAENLLLFGPSGVGKTHLAAGRSARAERSGSVRRCVELAADTAPLRRGRRFWRRLGGHRPSPWRPHPVAGPPAADATTAASVRRQRKMAQKRHENWPLSARH